MLSLIFGQKDQPTLPGKSLDIGRVNQPAGSNVALDHIFEVLLEEGHVPLGHFDHTGTIGVATSYRCPKIGQTGGYYGSQIPRAKDSDLHHPPPGWHMTCRRRL